MSTNYMVKHSSVALKTVKMLKHGTEFSLF